MSDSITVQVRQYFTARATLVGIGVKGRSLGLFQPIAETVRMGQKTVKYSPTEKRLDGWIAMLAGAHGLAEINKRVRPDAGRQLAFGRRGCAEQSLVQDTLDAGTTANVEQMPQALHTLYRQPARGYRHDYAHGTGWR